MKDLTTSATSAAASAVAANLVQAGNSNKNVGVRKTLTDMGFKNDNIGYDGTNVTYNGQYIVKPDSIVDDTAFASEENNYSGAMNYLLKNGYKGVRDELNSKGIDNSRIGYNKQSGAVTIDGNDVFTPQYNVNGTTYASDADINRMAQVAHERNKNNGLVATRDYAAKNGFGNLVGWDGENVLIGGHAITPAYIRDGTSYVSKSKLDNIIAQVKADAGITGNQGVINENEEKYGKYRDDALNRIITRPEFDWDPSKDVSFQRHTEYQTALADDAYRRVLNDNNTSVGGASGAVLSEALAAKNKYLNALAEDERLYREGAYSKYLDSGDWDRRVLSDIVSVSDGDYSKKYTANRDSYSDSVSAQSVNNEEKWRWNDWNLAEKKDNREAFDYVISVASARGEFLPEDEKYIPGLWRYRNSDGTYSITPTQAEIEYTKAMSYAQNYGANAGGYDAYNEYYRR